MKIRFVILISLLNITINFSGQNPFSGKDSARIEQQVIEEAESLREHLFKTYKPNSLYSSPEIKKYEIEFMVDTFMIERRMKLQMDLDYSTVGMANATYCAEEHYDILLNKYYKTLLNNLSPSDAKIVREAQRSWLKFRETELEVQSRFIWIQEGGTIAITLSAGYSLGFMKTRVKEIFRYMLISIENKYFNR